MSTRQNVLLQLEIPGLRKHIAGKVREVFDLGDSLLIVATDRISAFDVILPTGVADKGRVLTQMSLYWFNRLSSVVDNHVISADSADISAAIELAGGTLNDELSAQLCGRTLLVGKARALPVECVARGYISGSLWNEYKTLPAHGGEVIISGVRLPAGLRESDRLPSPIFTPATKAHEGHDENVSQKHVEAQLGVELTCMLRDTTLTLYTRASEQALTSGLIIADTKFEFGLIEDKLVWIDEALTPDSSRFWDTAVYSPGRPQDAFDKQYVRDYLLTLDWDKSYPGPPLPEDVAARTTEKYRDAFRRITGRALD